MWQGGAAYRTRAVPPADDGPGGLRSPSSCRRAERRALERGLALHALADVMCCHRSAAQQSGDPHRLVRAAGVASVTGLTAPGLLGLVPEWTLCGARTYWQPLSRQRTRVTLPAINLRSELHLRRLRYYVGRKPVQDPRHKADAGFRDAASIVIDGSFGTVANPRTRPKRNESLWHDKIMRTRCGTRNRCRPSRPRVGLSQR